MVSAPAPPSTSITVMPATAKVFTRTALSNTWRFAGLPGSSRSVMMSFAPSPVTSSVVTFSTAVTAASAGWANETIAAAANVAANSLRERPADGRV